MVRYGYDRNHTLQASSPPSRWLPNNVVTIASSHRTTDIQASSQRKYYGDPDASGERARLDIPQHPSRDIKGRQAKLKPVLAGLSLLGIWEAAGYQGLVDTRMIPRPTSVLSATWPLIQSGELQQHLVASLIRVTVGFAGAAVIGIAIGVILGSWKSLAETFEPIVETLRPIPPIAWIPLAILWFGIGHTTAYFVVFIGAVFPIYLSTYAAVRRPEQLFVNAARCLGATQWTVLRRIVLPSALPRILTGLRIGMGFAWMSVVAAELVAARSGLGYLIQSRRQLLDTEVVIVGMIAIGLVGMAANWFLVKLEGWIVPWAEQDAGY